jgi:hypothetical protein
VLFSPGDPDAAGLDWREAHLKGAKKKAFLARLQLEDLTKLDDFYDVSECEGGTVPASASTGFGWTSSPWALHREVTNCNVTPDGVGTYYLCAAQGDGTSKEVRLRGILPLPPRWFNRFSYRPDASLEKGAGTFGRVFDELSRFLSLDAKPWHPQLVEVFLVPERGAHDARPVPEAWTREAVDKGGGLFQVPGRYYQEAVSLARGPVQWKGSAFHLWVRPVIPGQEWCPARGEP